MPRQQVGDLPSGMVGDTGENVGEVELRVEAVKLGGFDQRVHGGGTVTAGIGTDEEIILTTDCDTAQRALGGIVVKSQSSVVEATAECEAATAHVAEGGGKLGFAGELSYGLVRPGGKRRRDRLRALLAFSSSMVGREAFDLY